MSNAGTKLAKLENTLVALERLAGITTDHEVIRQNADGTWPEPKTEADLIIERVNFRAQDDMR
jgi:hypothetical protein